VTSRQLRTTDNISVLLRRLLRLPPRHHSASLGRVAESGVGLRRRRTQCPPAGRQHRSAARRGASLISPPRSKRTTIACRGRNNNLHFSTSARSPARSLHFRDDLWRARPFNAYLSQSLVTHFAPRYQPQPPATTTTTSSSSSSSSLVFLPTSRCNDMHMRHFNSPEHGSNLQHIKHQAKTNLIKSVVTGEPTKLLRRRSNCTLGNTKSKCSRHIITTCISVVLNNFMKKRLTTKSSEASCDLFRGSASIYAPRRY